jgi:hypothetical protein
MLLCFVGLKDGHYRTGNARLSGMINTPKIAFHTHKRGAKARGIRFHFTYDEWVAWWMKHLGPDWFSKRGRKRGQYVMARNRDKGPYSIWNVKCVLARDNHRATNHSYCHGEKSKSAILKPFEVLEIYRSKLTHKQLARKYDCSLSAINGIKRNHTWVCLTKNIRDEKSSTY